MTSYEANRGHARRKKSKNFKRQRDLIVQCARTCFERKGVHKTTLVDISREAEMTRELIYYYFSGKDEIVGCVVDSYMQDADETVRLWCEQWESDVAVDQDGAAEPLSREAVTDAVASIRRFVFQQDGTRRSMFYVLDEIGQRHSFFKVMCDQITSTAMSYGISRQIQAMWPHLCNDDGEMAFKIVFLGVIGIMEGAAAREDARIVNLLLSGVHSESFAQ
ncbi:MAG: TetR/AcrR family transcriptional regulator [Atopobiaceae bacterium]|nr:TetR/AcrR family transcriptional regulator [Atopobiaceae bacterium]